jgi:UrcA family protein
MIKSSLLAAAVVAAALPVCGQAAAGQDLGLPSTIVRYHDLDLAKESDAAALMDRLRVASSKVCATGLRGARFARQEATCRVRTLDAAVMRVNAPRLTELRNREAPASALAE